MTETRRAKDARATHVNVYARAAADPGAWREFAARYLAGDEAAYQKAVLR